MAKQNKKLLLMNDYPIIFTGPMVRAILEGRKTQTRRVLRKQPLDVLPMPNPIVPNQREWVILETRDPKPHGSVIRCLFGVPGDHLWVRETWARSPTGIIRKADFKTDDGFGAEVVDLATGRTVPLIWKPSIHMPRSVSRITLEIVGVRVERLQTITQADAKAEGVSPLTISDGGWVPVSGYDYVGAFRELWNSINTKRGHAWSSNPWVWVIEFKRLEEA